MTMVLQGLLALRLKNPWDDQQWARTTLLLKSLDRYWTGSSPFVLRVVGVDREMAVLRTLPRQSPSGRVQTVVYSENEFFEPSSAFHLLAPRYKQQLIKLVVPAALGMGSFLTFDADVACIRTFDELTFVHGGRLISQWEPRDVHSWWRNCSTVLGVPSNIASRGLSVTPNVLSADLCADVLRYLQERHGDPVEFLHAASVPAKTVENWTEYTLYTLVAERAQTLAAAHIPATVLDRGRVKLHSRRSVWYPPEVKRLGPDYGDEGYFLVVQSRVRVPVGTIYQLVPELAELRAGQP